MVGIPDDIDTTVPKVHIVLKEDYIGKEEQVKQELIEMFNDSELPSYFEPVDYKFRESMPLTNIGKVDFISLINEDIEKEKILKKQI